MKHYPASKPALWYLITGLLLTTLTPVINRYYPLPDSMRGFITGLGLAIEMIAIVKLQRSRQKQHICQI
ncbi:hypothetical protein [Mucilaginibacter koreensis]